MKLFAFFALIFVLAGGAFAYSRTLPHMHDPAGFDAAYTKLGDAYQDSIGRNDFNTDHFDDAYEQLFTAHVTARNAIKKYSLTTMVLAATGMLLFCFGIKGLKTPPNKWLLLLVGIAGMIATTWGGLADTNEVFGRSEAPYWSNMDKAGIGIMLTFPPICLLIIALNMALLFGKRFNVQAVVYPLNLRRLNWFVMACLCVAIALTVWLAYDGGWYFSLSATPFWLYFYLSILAIRAKGHELAGRGTKA